MRSDNKENREVAAKQTQKLTGERNALTADSLFLGGEVLHSSLWPVDTPTLPKSAQAVGPARC